MVVVYLNHGRWVADCSNPACYWALGASLSEWRRMEGWLCGRMANGLVDASGCGHEDVLGVPDETMERDIMSVMRKRINPANRNWRPNESYQDLVRENEEHGL